MAGIDTKRVDICITREQLDNKIRELKSVFDIVRVVNVCATRVITFMPDGTQNESDNDCFGVWHKKQRCANCISARVFSNKGRASKFEFVGDQIFFVVAQYIEVDGAPYVLEIVHKISDDFIMDSRGRNEFVEKITSFNDKLFIDSLTGTRNRKYYDEQLKGLICEGVAIIDADRFKYVNDTFGHKGGDRALELIASAIKSCVRDSDMLVRYGGDEFVLCFERIQEPALAERLEAVRRRVEGLRSEEYPDMRLSLSIGGFYGRDTADNMLRRADEALYQSKTVRNKVTVVKQEKTQD